MKKFTFLTMLALGVLGGMAQDFTFNDVLYSVLDADAKTCTTQVGSVTPGNLAKGPNNEFAGDLVIPEWVTDGQEKYKVVEIGDYSFAEANELTSVKLPSTVTYIGKQAFARCNKLLTVEMENSVTEIGPSAFSNSYNMTSLKLSEALTEIPDNMCRACSGLLTIEIPESVTVINEEAFWCCYGMKPTLPSKLEIIGGQAFVGCEFEELVLPNTVTSIGAFAFQSCRMTTVTVPQSITELSSHIFVECLWTEEFNLPSTLTKVGDGAFNSCTEVKTMNCYALTPPECEAGLNDRIYCFSGIPFETAELHVVTGTRELYAEAEGWKDFQNIIDDLEEQPEETPGEDGGDEDAVESIEADGTAEAVYYNLQGVMVKNPAPGSILVKKTGNKVVKVRI